MTRAHGLVLAIVLALSGLGAAQLVWKHLAQAQAGGSGELRRCRDLAAPAAADADCREARREARRRFLGGPAAR